MKPRRSSPTLRVYLLGEGNLWRAELLEGDKLPWNHQHATGIEEADAVFLWLWAALPSAQLGFELGQAHALNKPVYTAAFNSDALDNAERELKYNFLQRIAFHPNVREGYSRVLADVDVTLPEAYRLTRAQMGGTCKGCGGSYKKGDGIRKGGLQGTYHADCYARMKDPDAVNAVVFNAALVEALRTDNAQLEQQLNGKRH